MVRRPAQGAQPCFVQRQVLGSGVFSAIEILGGFRNRAPAGFDQGYATAMRTELEGERDTGDAAADDTHIEYGVEKIGRTVLQINDHDRSERRETWPSSRYCDRFGREPSHRR